MSSGGPQRNGRREEGAFYFFDTDSDSDDPKMGIVGMSMMRSCYTTGDSKKRTGTDQVTCVDENKNRASKSNSVK